jgi:diadenosine tetraphosphatase ApaH/serine/threonine PP2A family protein phosphatase
LLELPNATWIRGNTERWLLDLPDDRPDARDRIIAAREAIGDEIAEALYQLPEQVRIDRVLYCHASPLNDMETFTPEPEPDERRLLGTVRDTTVVFGHSHLQFRRLGAQGVKLVNPGSVGMSADGDTAAWMLRRADGGFEFRRTPF